MALEYAILAPGEKIRTLRENMGLNQDDLTDDRITRSLISMIENGKRKLTYKTAIIIAEKLNCYYSKLGKEITTDYLLNEEVDQVKEIASDFLKKHQIHDSIILLGENQVELFFDPIIKLVKEWCLKKELSEILFLRGQYYNKLTDYYRALQDYFSSLEYFLETSQYENVALLYLKIGTNFYMLEHFQESLLYFKRAIFIAQEEKIHSMDRVIINSTFNTILSYRKLKNYDMVFEYLNKIRQHKISTTLCNNLSLIEANNYLDLGMWERSEKLYRKLLNKDLEKDNCFLVYDSLADLYIQKEQYETALDYGSKAFKLLDDLDKMYTSMIIIKLAKIYSNLGQATKGIELLRKYFEVITIYNQKVDLLLQLAEIHLSINKTDDAVSLLNNANELILINNFESKKPALYALFCEVYEKLDDREKLKLYLNKIKSL